MVICNEVDKKDLQPGRYILFPSATRLNLVYTEVGWDELHVVDSEGMWITEVCLQRSDLR